MKLRFIIFVAFVLAFGSCSILGTEAKQSRIVGPWELESATTTGFTPPTASPDSGGRSRQHLSFSSKGRFSLYRADTLFVSGTYAWEKLEKEDKWIISYDPDSDIFLPRQFVRFEDDDELILTDWCADCFVYRYVRPS